MASTVNPVDRNAIVEVCNSLGWLTDRREWNELRSLFAPSVYLDYTSLWGGEARAIHPGELVAGWRRTLGGLAATQHLIAGHLVEIDGEEAVCLCNFLAVHAAEFTNEKSIWTVGGQYRLEFRHLEGEWRISTLTMTALWETGNRSIVSSAAA